MSVNLRIPSKKCHELLGNVPPILKMSTNKIMKEWEMEKWKKIDKATGIWKRKKGQRWS